MPSFDSLPERPELERVLEAIEINQYEDFFQALPPEVAEELGMECHREGRVLRITATGYDHPMFNRVLGVGLDPEPPEDGPEAALARAAAYYGSAGVRRWMLQLLPHVEPDGFAERAALQGVVPLRGWAKHLGRADLEISAPSSLQVVRLGLEDPTGTAPQPPLIDAWTEIVGQNFGFPPSFTPWLRALHGRDRWILYLALDEKAPVATGALYLSECELGLVGQLTFGSTLPEHRRRGAQSALLARRVADARAAGARWVVSETDEERPERPNPSTRNLVRMGLPVVYVRGNWGPPKPGE